MKNWYLEIFVRFNESAEISFPRPRDSKCIFEVSRGKTFVEKLMKDVGYIYSSFLFLFLITIHRETLILEARTLKQRISSSKVWQTFSSFHDRTFNRSTTNRSRAFLSKTFCRPKIPIVSQYLSYKSNLYFFILFIKYSSSYSKGTFPINFTKKNNWNIER